MSSSSSSLLPPPTPPSAGAIGGTSSSFLPSFMIIAALLAFVFLASVSIHLLLRFLSERSPSPAATLPRTRRDDARSGSGQAEAEDGAARPEAAADDGKKGEAGDEKQRLIESLPLFTMASALAALPKSSPDCAVCLSPFTPDAELRLLPACRHAFHAACVDAWLRTTPSCPLCRAAVTLPHPSLSAMLAAAQQPPPPLPEPRSRDWSRSFRVEIGTVSNRGSPAPFPGGGGGNRYSRTYSLGSSFDYHIDEEVEAVVSRAARAAAAAANKEVKPLTEHSPAPAPAPAPSPSPPGEAVAQTAGSSRGWLREYVDRLASSAYTFSERWSSRWSMQSQQRHEEPWLWDAEAAEMSSAPGPDEEETAFMVLYRWIAGV
ncbi:hypothetical protein ACP70R_010202 [Stipagrostis hirtigluma subsp. patula]